MVTGAETVVSNWKSLCKAGGISGILNMCSFYNNNDSYRYHPHYIFSMEEFARYVKFRDNLFGRKNQISKNINQPK
jgi:hypothetical protein